MYMQSLFIVLSLFMALLPTCTFSWWEATNALSPLHTCAPYSLLESESACNDSPQSSSIFVFVAVADYVGHGFSHSQCLHRWFNSTNPTIKKGRWSENEDEVYNNMHVHVHVHDAFTYMCMMHSVYMHEHFCIWRTHYCVYAVNTCTQLLHIYAGVPEAHRIL